jgi:hypothetical protein
MNRAMLWRTRVIWALLGAGVTLAIDNVREHGDGDAKAQPSASTEASVEPTPSVQSEPAPTVESTLPTPVESTLPTPVESADAPIAVLIDDVLESPIPDVPSFTEPTADTVEAVPADPVGPPASAVEPYEIPLPLMPGGRIMKRSHKAHEHSGTVHTLALFVPAPGRQVEAFYRSALTDAKLSVSGGNPKPSTMGSGHRSSLLGRSRDAIVHVNVQQSAGTLRTVVRIIWRRLP